ncbi:MAG TPA: hypothetical protein VER17_10740 [Tepidisphaeraceae bacterium]|nr:hypothetical protein [Tepidisphaeraceae bacterium]
MTKLSKTVAVLTLAAATSAVLAQTKPATREAEAVAGEVVGVVDETSAAPATQAAATESAATQAAAAGSGSTTGPATGPATNPSTGPASKPVARIDKFLKTKVGRTAQSSLQALSAPEDPKADEPARYQRHVQAGRWDEVAKVIASFKGDDAKKLYKQLVQQLASGESGGGGTEAPSPSGAGVEARMRSARVIVSGGGAPQVVQGGPGAGGGGPHVLPQDVIAVLNAAPADFDDDLTEPLGQLVQVALSRADVIDPIVAALDKGVRNLGGSEEASRYRAAQVLAAAGRAFESGKFLPPLKDDLAENDPKLLDLHAKFLLAKIPQARDEADALRARAWQVSQAQMIHQQADAKQRDAAVARALELFPALSKDATAGWFKEGLSKQQQGTGVLASLAQSLAQAFQNRDSDRREKGLRQQRQLVDGILSNAGGEPARWAPALNVLAMAWLHEADYARNRPSQRDMTRQRNQMYGPYYEGPPPQMNNGNEPPPLDAKVLLESAPPEPWLAQLDPSLAVRVRAAVAEMHFKDDEPLSAMPIIELLAKTHSKTAGALADSLVMGLSRAWDPNQSSMSRRYSSSMYYGPYGYMQQSEGGIPLTRSAQARNLAELSETLKKLAALPIEPVSDGALVAAFSNAHSAAEVFRIEDLQSVFGPPEKMKRETLAELLQTMRQRLATSWRSPQVQQQAKTKRTDKELDAEVTRGYALLVELLEHRVAREQDWKLMTILGSALFDWAEYDYGKQVELAIYTARRDKAFIVFHQAADKYQAALPTLKESEQSSFVHQQWFNAALGASDLAALTRQAAPSQTQIDQVRAALLAIPGKELAEKHMAGFARWLGDAPGSIKPELKHRFLKAGLQVAGDHPAAEPARKLVQYYADLLTEVELHAAVEGDPVVGHAAPFGLHLTIRHTAAVGRESGGFNKYLTNPQSRSGGYYYPGPSGQGPVNYRDDFEKKVRGALAERFEIQSITWYDEKVESRPFGRPGWRETPVAYVLLKPKDAAVDKVPPIAMDMDFSDRTGTVILPVTSQVLLVDARPAAAPPRPVQNIEVTQILDQRDAANGKLTLDIKATAKGLLPDLAGLLDVNIPGFTVEKIADNGLAVNSMDVEGDPLRPQVERSWLINLAAAGGTRGEAAFKFPQAKSTDVKVLFKRYADADVADVDPQVAVTGLPLGKGRGWLWATVALVLVAAAVATMLLLRRRRKIDAPPPQPYAVPQHVSPFTVIDLLKRMEHDPEIGLSPAQREQLTGQILHLQEKFFSPKPNGEAAPNLSAIASHWVGQAQRQP